MPRPGRGTPTARRSKTFTARGPAASLRRLTRENTNLSEAGNLAIEYLSRKRDPNASHVPSASAYE